MEGFHTLQTQMGHYSFRPVKIKRKQSLEKHFKALFRKCVCSHRCCLFCYNNLLPVILKVLLCVHQHHKN